MTKSNILLITFISLSLSLLSCTDDNEIDPKNNPLVGVWEFKHMESSEWVWIYEDGKKTDKKQYFTEDQDYTNDPEKPILTLKADYTGTIKQTFDGEAEIDHFKYVINGNNITLKLIANDTPGSQNEEAIVTGTFVLTGDILELNLTQTDEDGGSTSTITLQKQ